MKISAWGLFECYVNKYRASVSFLCISDSQSIFLARGDFWSESINFNASNMSIK